MCDRGRTITHMQIPQFHTQVSWDISYVMTYHIIYLDIWYRISYMYDYKPRNINRTTASFPFSLLIGHQRGHIYYDALNALFLIFMTDTIFRYQDGFPGVLDDSALISTHIRISTDITSLWWLIRDLTLTNISKSLFQAHLKWIYMCFQTFSAIK